MSKSSLHASGCTLVSQDYDKQKNSRSFKNYKLETDRAGQALLIIK